MLLLLYIKQLKYIIEYFFSSEKAIEENFIIKIKEKLKNKLNLR